MMAGALQVAHSLVALDRRPRSDLARERERERLYAIEEEYALRDALYGW